VTNSTAAAGLFRLIACGAPKGKRAMNKSTKAFIAGTLILSTLTANLTIAAAATTGGPSGGSSGSVSSGSPDRGGQSGSAESGDRGGESSHRRRGVMPFFPMFQNGFQTRFPPRPAADGYPTPGKAISKCGGVDNVMIVTEYDEDGTVGPVTYYCV